MSLQIFPTATVDTAAIEAQVADAKAAADAASERAGRAMQRANAADATGTAAHDIATAAQAETVTLAQLAQQLGAAIPASEATHAAINKRIDDIALTPGPKGDPGKDGASIKGDKGDTGPAGTANLAIGVAPVGLVALGGSTTVVVPLAKTLTTAPANVQVAHSAVVNLATVTLAVTAKTTSSVTVKVTATGVAVAAGTLLVLAF